MCFFNIFVSLYTSPVALLTYVLDCIYTYVFFSAPSYISSSSLGDQIYITRGHAREPDGQRARKLKDLVCAKGRPEGLALVRRSISTCMRNAVAGFSIMWVYKRARAPSHLETARRSHTFSRLRTLGRVLPLFAFFSVACSMNLGVDL